MDSISEREQGEIVAKILQGQLFPKPATVPAEVVSKLPYVGDMSPADKRVLMRVGVTRNDLSAKIQQASMIAYERSAVYQECDRATTHWMVAAALELYADTCTTYSPMEGATVWVTSDSARYQNTGNSSDTGKRCQVLTSPIFVT